MKKSLSSISDDFLAGVRTLSTAMESGDDESVFEQMCLQIAGTEADLEKKTTDIKSFLDFLDSKRKSLRQYKDDANAAIGVITRAEARIKEYVLFCLKKIEGVTGKKYVENFGLKIRYQKQGKKDPVRYTEEMEIPFEYKNFSITISDLNKKDLDLLIGSLPECAKNFSVKSEPNSEKILFALKSGKEVKGAYIGEQSEGIRISVPTT